jgi:hypothetical protein
MEETWAEKVWREYVEACDRYHSRQTTRTPIPAGILRAWDDDGELPLTGTNF